MKNIKKILPVFIIGLFFIVVNPAHAQQPSPPSVNVTLSPIFFDYSSSPSATIKDKIRIHNNTDNPIPFKLAIKKIITDNSGNLSLEDPKPDDDLPSWIKFTSPQFTAAPQDWTDIPFTINIPPSAAFGYYFGIDFIPDNGSAVNNGAALSGQPLVPVLLTVKAPGLKKEGQVTNFGAQAFINEDLPIEFITKFQNTGNVHLKPHGNIFIQSHDQKDLAVLDVNKGLGNVLPGATRTFSTDWGDGFMVNEPELDSASQPILDKNGNKVTHFVLHWDKLTHFRFGPYTANLVLVFDNGERDQVLESSTTFWVIPYKLILGVIVGLAIIFFGIRFLIRSYVKSLMKRKR